MIVRLITPSITSHLPISHTGQTPIEGTRSLRAKKIRCRRSGYADSSVINCLPINMAGSKTVLMTRAKVDSENDPTNGTRAYSRLHVTPRILVLKCQDGRRSNGLSARCVQSGEFDKGRRLVRLTAIGLAPGLPALARWSRREGSLSNRPRAW